MVCSNSPRSIRKPMESNSMMGRISKEVKRLRAWEESSTSAAESISIGLSGIADLYKCIISNMTKQQLLSLHNHEKCVVELLEVSSKLLEVCGSTQDLALEMKQASRDLQTGLSNGVSSQDSSLLSFICSRKKIIKSSRKILSSLSRIGGERFGGVGDGDQGVLEALKCIVIISISIQETLLLFLGTRTKPKSSIFSKLISKGKASLCDGEVGRNELESVDAVICALSSFESVEKMRLVRKRLEVLETGIQGIESGLDSMISQLTQTRVMLLKISSSWS